MDSEPALRRERERERERHRGRERATQSTPPGAAVIAAALAALAAATAMGCATVDVKGRETLRVGPLREAAVLPSVATAPAPIDAGTDALTDDELAAIAASLPAALSHALAARADAAAARSPRALGQAHIRGCRLRAGPGRAHTVYEARCRVSVLVGDVPVIEVHTEALRRVRARAISEDEAKAMQRMVRNPLLSADDGRLALVAALEAAAALIVDGKLANPPDAPPTAALSRQERASLARERLAKDSKAAGAPARAALFDLSASGTPHDALAVLPFLTHEDAQVRLAAVDALGELCAPWSAERLEPLTVENAAEPELRSAAGRALTRVRACASFAR